jgi:hypothetical protein
MTLTPNDTTSHYTRAGIRVVRLLCHGNLPQLVLKFRRLLRSGAQLRLEVGLVKPPGLLVNLRLGFGFQIDNFGSQALCLVGVRLLFVSVSV